MLLAPTVEVRPISAPEPLDAAINALANYDWLVFTSANGVRFFIDRLRIEAATCGAGHLKLAAIGGNREALAGFHLLRDLVPETFRSEALAAALQEYSPRRSVCPR